eukprot:gene31690-41135_t
MAETVINITQPPHGDTNMVDIKCILDPKIEIISIVGCESDAAIQQFQKNADQYSRAELDSHEPLKHLDDNSIGAGDSVKIVAAKVAKYLVGPSYESQWEFVGVKETPLPQNSDKPVYGRCMKIWIICNVSPMQKVRIFLRLYKHGNDENIREHLQRYGVPLAGKLEVGRLYVTEVKTVSDLPKGAVPIPFENLIVTNTKSGPAKKRRVENDGREFERIAARVESIESFENNSLAESSLATAGGDAIGISNLSFYPSNSMQGFTYQPDHNIVSEAYNVGKVFVQQIGPITQEIHQYLTPNGTDIQPGEHSNGFDQNFTGGNYTAPPPGGNHQLFQSSAQQNNYHYSTNSMYGGNLGNVTALNCSTHEDSSIKKPVLFNMEASNTRIKVPHATAVYDSTTESEKSKTVDNTRIITLRNVMYFCTVVLTVAAILFFISMILSDSTQGRHGTAEPTYSSNLTWAETDAEDNINSTVSNSTHHAATPTPTLPDAQTIIVLIGRTGDGKSTSGNLMASILGYESEHQVLWENSQGSPRNPFLESAGSDSHTVLPRSFTIQGFRVIDTPGLMDSRGLEKDEENVVEIVKYLIREGFVN